MLFNSSLESFDTLEVFGKYLKDLPGAVSPSDLHWISEIYFWSVHLWEDAFCACFTGIFQAFVWNTPTAGANLLKLSASVPVIYSDLLPSMKARFLDQAFSYLVHWYHPFWL